MLQNPCKTLGFKKIMVFKIPQPVAYKVIFKLRWHCNLRYWYVDTRKFISGRIEFNLVSSLEKSDFEACNHVTFKPACLATETSYNIELLHVASLAIILS